MARDELRWWKFSARDWVSDPDKRFLSPAQKGILIQLMCYFWIRGPLPDDIEKLALLADVSPDTFRDHWPDLEQFFETDEDGRIVHPKLADLHRESLEKHRARKRAGKKGAEKRWGPTNEKGDSPSGGEADGVANAEGNGGANGGAMASKETRGKNADERGRHLGEEGGGGAGDGAKGTTDTGACPECGEVEIRTDEEICSHCFREREARTWDGDRDDPGTNDDLDLPF